MSDASQPITIICDRCRSHFGEIPIVGRGTGEGTYLKRGGKLIWRCKGCGHEQEWGEPPNPTPGAADNAAPKAKGD